MTDTKTQRLTSAYLNNRPALGRAIERRLNSLTPQSLVDLVVTTCFQELIGGSFCVNTPNSNQPKTLLFVLAEKAPSPAYFWTIKVQADPDSNIDAVATYQRLEPSLAVSNLLAMCDRLIQAITPVGGEKVLG